MALIRPTRSFEGSASNSSLFKLVKDGVQVVNFRDEKNQAGNHFFILPPYKVDRLGNGVSWKVLDVRIDFGVGDGMKERFVSVDGCPVAYFEKRAKLLYPDYAKVEVEKRPDGQDRKRYPTYGRNQKQVLFNVAYFRDVASGCHAMHLPWFNAAEKIDEWHRTKTPEGLDNPLVNDPAAALPVWVQLRSGQGVNGNPWLVRVDNSKAYTLPEQLCDTDNLYNLDDILLIPEPKVLIEKLRAITPGPIFDACMREYLQRMVHGDQIPEASAVPVARATTVQVAGPVPSAEPDDVPMNYDAPVPVAPAPSGSSGNPIVRTVVPQAVQSFAPAPVQTVESVPQPVAGPAGSREAARAFLQARKPV